MSYSVMYNQVGKVNVNYILDPELYVLKDFELVAVSAMEVWFKTCTSICHFFLQLKYDLKPVRPFAR